MEYSFSTISKMLNIITKRNIHPSFFIYGPSGVGKTHLLKRYSERQHARGKKIACLSMSTLIEKIILAPLQLKSMSSVFQSMADLDILIIDDCDVLKDRPATQQLIFTEIKKIQERTGLRLIMATSLLPREFTDEVGLLEFFNDGMIVDINKPSLEERRLVFIRRMKKNGIFVANDIAMSMVEELKTFSQIMGVCNRIEFELKRG